MPKKTIMGAATKTKKAAKKRKPVRKLNVKIVPTITVSNMPKLKTTGSYPSTYTPTARIDNDVLRLKVDCNSFNMPRANIKAWITALQAIEVAMDTKYIATKVEKKAKK